MTPDEFYRYVDREFNHHREDGIRDLNEGNANPGDRYTAALTISEEMVHQVFGNTDHFDLWCREHGFRMTAREGYGQYRIQREYRAQRIATRQALDPVLGWDQEPDTPIAIAETVEWTLTDVFHRPNQDTVHIGLGDIRHENLELAQGGYIVPPDIAGFILGNHTQLPQPTPRSLDFTKLLYEGSQIERIHKAQEEASHQREASLWARSVTRGV